VLSDWMLNALAPLDLGPAVVVMDDARWTSPNPYEVKARVVCEKCNNGWMNDIDQAARPFLEPMMLGDRPDELVLDRIAQNAVSLWAAMTAFTMEHIRPAMPLLSTSDYHAFYQGRVVPSGWKVWMARFNGLRPTRVLMRATLGVSDKKVSVAGRELAVRYSTMAIGHLVLQVRAQPMGSGASIDVTGLPDFVRVPVHPAGNDEASWPPTHDIDDDGLGVLALDHAGL
jgi:hypothetical protein